ncbi:MAG TPA: efflux RND transporter periplasmic adaptor subunit [Gammaproteobacteria bacterium]|nr:efflux RND transporter periplasmic adaptor subunit [Gammaproteobacteria bacterium]
MKNKTGLNLLVIIALGMTCFIPNASAADTPASSDTLPPALPVDIVIIKEQPRRLWTEFSGRLTAVDFAEIRPQATGLITRVKFKDGQFVNKGDVLYIIDPRPLKAIVEQEEANLIVAQNHFSLADKEYRRAQDLIRDKLISQQIYDERKNTKLVTGSAVKRAEAKLSEARINLGYAYIRAPFSGRVSRAELTEGNLVSAGPNAPLLTTIVSSASIYADFEVDEQTYSHYMKGVSSTQKNAPEGLVELQLQSDDTVYRGKIHAFDNRIDPASGTIRVRAIFDNPQGKLLPGMYAHLKLGSSIEEKIILISERAIGTDQNRKFVYVVNDKNKTTYREVHLGKSIGGDRVIRSGLSDGDRVIVRGLMRIQPDMLVDPKIAKTVDTKATKT